MHKIGLPPVISLTGVGQVGKSEVAKYLRERYGYGGDHINEPMVAMAIPLLERMGCSRDDAISRLTTDRKAEPIPGYEWLTGRKILQAIGYDLRNALGRLTDVEMDEIDEGFFLDMWERRHSDFERLVNESARYPVEIDWTDDRGGIVILVDAKNAKAANNHVSETKSLRHDYLLFNEFDGLPKLHAKVDHILRQWSSPRNRAYEMAERRQLPMYTDELELVIRIDGDVRYGDGRPAFEALEREMSEVLLNRTRQRFPDDEEKLTEMEDWLRQHRSLQRNRAALVISHYGVANFNSRYAALKKEMGTIQAEESAASSEAPTLGAVSVSGGWRGTWSFGDEEVIHTPLVHPTEQDAVEDARRRAMWSRDPDAEADEFEDAASTDPSDPDVRYGSIFYDDENRWRGRWYRSAWSDEGAYTDLLYDTPGQARRAARRIRNGDRE